MVGVIDSMSNRDEQPPWRFYRRLPSAYESKFVQRFTWRRTMMHRPYSVGDRRNERLLLPIGKNRRSEASVRYVLQVSALGIDVDVCLLHVLEPLGYWQSFVPSNTESEDALARQKGERVLAKAAAPLVANRIAHSCYLKTGNLAFTILDTAEELACRGIVMPLPHSICGRFCYGDLIYTLSRCRGSMPLIMVGE